MVCYGGPYDGATATAKRAAFGWIGPQGRVYSKAGESRALYLRAEGEWIYAGERGYVCDCGTAIHSDACAGEQQVCPACGVAAP